MACSAPTSRAALVAAHVAAALGLPSSDPDAALAARDKRRMRQRLEAAGVPGPRVCVLEPLQGAADLHDAAFPCVVKPPMLSGSQGVIRADDEASLDTAIARVRGILARHPSSWREHPDFHRLLVEDYIDGPEVAVEALMHDGQLELVALFDKPDDLVGPFFEETIYVTPSRHAPAVQTQILDVTGRAARALGLVHGPVHAELRIGAAGPEVVELAGRSIGGLCSRTLELCADNLEERLVAHAVGLPRRDAQHEAGTAAGVMMIPIPRSGVFRSASGVERARGVDGNRGASSSQRDPATPCTRFRRARATLASSSRAARSPPASNPRCAPLTPSSSSSSRRSCRCCDGTTLPALARPAVAFPL